MPTTKTHDLCVATDTYEKDGETKNRYLNIGSVMKNDDGDGANTYILLDRTFNPAGVKNPDNRSNILISVFEHKPKNTAPEF